MEQDKILTGYCRQLDSSRIVEAVLEDGKLTEVDCCYGSCVYEGSCPIAKSLDELK